jgi:asparagine synthase (glutamine-hydrolysing)
MTGLIAVFDAKGSNVSLGGLIAQLPTHASRSEQWHDSFCAMARLHHGVLETTPQPAFNDAESLCLFLDGEIYASPDGRDDARLPAAVRLLRIYEHGANALADINGSFSAIIYDRPRRRIILISDRFGTRPLYYFRAGSSLVVASHVAALTAHSRCPKLLDRATVHQVLAYEVVIGHGTIYRDVHLLEPGATLNFDGDSLDVRRYWTMQWRQPFSSKEDAGEALAEQVRRAVSRRANGSLRVGLLLSGGFDSRLVLAAAGRGISCITQAASHNREVGIAERVAQLMGAEFRFIQVDPARSAELFDEAVRLTAGVQKAQACHFLPTVEGLKEWCDVLLSGWAFNSIYRGAILPVRTFKIGRFVTRPPQLIEIRPDDLIRLIVRTQRDMPGWTILAQILDDRARSEHYAMLEDAVRSGLGGFDGSSPSSLHNAWDYLRLRAISRHKDFGNVLSIRTWMDDRVVALDFDLVDTALRLRPEWRRPPIAYNLALQQILPKALANLPHAETGTRPSRIDRGLGLPIVSLRRTLRKAHIWSRSADLHPLGTQGSWSNFEAILRHHSAVRDRLRGLPDSEALGACDMFNRHGLRSVINANIEGKQSNTRLMYTLLSLESWIRQFGAS